MLCLLFQMELCLVCKWLHAILDLLEGNNFLVLTNQTTVPGCVFLCGVCVRCFYDYEFYITWYVFTL